MYWEKEPTTGDIWPAYHTAGPVSSSFFHGWITLYAFSRTNEMLFRVNLSCKCHNHHSLHIDYLKMKPPTSSIARMREGTGGRFMLTMEVTTSTCPDTLYVTKRRKNTTSPRQPRVPRTTVHTLPHTNYTFNMQINIRTTSFYSMKRERERERERESKQMAEI